MPLACINVEMTTEPRAKIRQAWQQIYAARGKEYRPHVSTDAGTAAKPFRAAPASAPINAGTTRDELGKVLKQGEEWRKLDRQRQQEQKKRVSFISRPSASPAPSGAGPRPAQKTATQLPAKTLPDVPATPQMVNYAWQNATAVPTHFQKPSEIRAAFGESKEGSSKTEKQERTRERSRGRTRTRTRSRGDDNEP